MNLSPYITCAVIDGTIYIQYVWVHHVVDLLITSIVSSPLMAAILKYELRPFVKAVVVTNFTRFILHTNGGALEKDISINIPITFAHRMNGGWKE